MEGWNLKAVEVLQAQSPPNLPFTSILTPPPPHPQIQLSPSRGHGFFMRLKAAQPWAEWHFKDNAAFWLLRAQIWPLLGILVLAHPSSDRVH